MLHHGCLRSFLFPTRYNAAGEFETYPPEASGGSILILRGETKTPSEFADFINKRKKMTPEQIKKVIYHFTCILLLLSQEIDSTHVPLYRKTIN